jgi:hypothetical protein
MTKQNAGIEFWFSQAGFARPSQPDKELTSNVPYREAFQCGAASRDREIDELRAYIRDVEEAVLAIQDYVAENESDINYKVLLSEIHEIWKRNSPTICLSAYHDSIVEKCAKAAKGDCLDYYDYGQGRIEAGEAVLELKEQGE